MLTEAADSAPELAGEPGDGAADAVGGRRVNTVEVMLEHVDLIGSYYLPEELVFQFGREDYLGLLLRR